MTKQSGGKSTKKASPKKASKKATPQTGGGLGSKPVSEPPEGGHVKPADSPYAS